MVRVSEKIASLHLEREMEEENGEKIMTETEEKEDNTVEEAEVEKMETVVEVAEGEREARVMEETEEEKKEDAETEKNDETVVEEKEKEEVPELPTAIVRRLLKDAISQCSKIDGDDMNVNKETLLAFSDSARIFIHYLSATANDICKESRRQTINGNDVLKALEDMDFPEFVSPLTSSLLEFKKKNASKKGATQTKEVKSKRKLQENDSSKTPESETKKHRGSEDNARDNETVRTESTTKV